MYPVLPKNVDLVRHSSGGVIVSLELISSPGRRRRPFREGEVRKQVGQEGMMWQDDVNRTGCEILEMCDGQHTFEDIVEVLVERHAEEPGRVEELVLPFLEAAAKKGHVRFAAGPGKEHGVVRGSPQVDLPRRVLLEVTQRCNLRCRHCYLGSAGDAHSEMDTGQMIELLCVLYEGGLIDLEFSGGETLLRPDIFELLEYCRDKVVGVGMTTNGTLVDEQKAEKLAQHRHLTIQVSVDGNEETHDQIRGDGAWAKALDGIRMLADAGCLVLALMTLNPLNIGQMEAVLHIVREAGASGLVFGTTLGAGRAPVEWELSAEQRMTTSHRIRELAAKYRDFYLQNPEEELRRAAEGPTVAELGNDGTGHADVAIAPNGDVRPSVLMPDLILGNLAHQDPQEVFASPWTEFLRHVPAPNRFICGDCLQLTTCQGCTAAGYIVSQRIATCRWLQLWRDCPSHRRPAWLKERLVPFLKSS